MAGSFNKVIMMGHLTCDPKLSTTRQQISVVEFGVTTNRKWTLTSGKKKDEVCFINCKAFGRLAENLSKFFKKGKPILFEGRLIFESWISKDGDRRSRHRIIVERFQFLPFDESKKQESSLDDAEEDEDSGLITDSEEPLTEL